MFNRRQAPFLLLTAICTVYMNGQMYFISQQHSDPFHVAIWQPLIPVIVTLYTLFSGHEAFHYTKTIGILLCIAALIGGIVFQVMSGYSRNGREFNLPIL